jgi:phage minor structural protein
LKYPIVYDKKETTFTGLGLAVLDAAGSVKIKEQINGEYLLSFILPVNDEKWQYIQPENFVVVEGQKFRVRSTDDIRDATGKLVSNVQCEHIWYDANDCKHIPYFEAIGQTPAQILASAFVGTPFTVGNVEITTPTDLFLDKTNPAAVANKLVENVGGELVRNNYTISLVSKRGNVDGIHFRIGKNIKSIKRATDSRDVITRLYPYGKDGMEIAGSYIDSPLISTYTNPKIGYKDYKDVEDPDELRTEALKEWSTAEKDGIDKPRVTYQVEVLELKKLKEYGDFESFSIGDTIRIIDEGLGIDTKQRIVEYEYYPYEPQRSAVALANYDTKLYREKSVGGMLAGFSSNKKGFEKVTDGKGKLNPHWFQNIKTKLQTLFNGSLKDAVMHNTGDIWVDNPDNPTKAMGIIADGFAIAKSKKANGDWDWKTFGTADGFFADLIVGGLLKGVTIEVDTDAKIGNTITVGAPEERDKKIILYNSGGNMSTIELNSLGRLNISNWNDMTLLSLDVLKLIGNTQVDISSLADIDLTASDWVHITGINGVYIDSTYGDVNLPSNTYAGSEQIATRAWVDANYVHK